MNKDVAISNNLKLTFNFFGDRFHEITLTKLVLHDTHKCSNRILSELSAKSMTVHFTRTLHIFRIFYWNESHPICRSIYLLLNSMHVCMKTCRYLKTSQKLSPFAIAFTLHVSYSSPYYRFFVEYNLRMTPAYSKGIAKVFRAQIYHLELRV